MSQLLLHEERLRRVEERVTTHEAVCEERYNNILATHTKTQNAVESLHGTVKEQVRYMLWALIVLALASVLGKDVITALAQKYVGG